MPSQAVHTITVNLLGGFGVTVDGAPVDEGAWRLKKARELVKLLALAPGHRLHREQAMDTLWRDREPVAAANNLYQAVHVARRALGAEAIDVRDELLSLAAEVDVDEFKRAARDARRLGTPAASRAALALYRGELLPENRYDDWAADRREELVELAEELAALAAGEGLRGLPTETSSFIGRGHELAELQALLKRTRLLTLTGTGGTGKTRLALELARSAEPSYEDGAVLVPLAPVVSPAEVTDAVALALDVKALPGQPLLDAVTDFLAHHSVLLVLDNCEHVLNAAAVLVDALLRAVPQLVVVTTSREPLRLGGEVLFRVASLAIPDPGQPHSPAELLRYEAVLLFVERAASAAPGFALGDENAADIARICFRLDGLPLALELAAGRLGALDPASVAERLDDRFRLLRAGSRAAPTRQQTLLATLQWSHDLLDDDERLLFRRVSVFAGGFELGAVEVVCADDALEEDDVADLLARLVEKSLVTVQGGAGERRYRLLETVGSYARERLVETDEGPALALRHARWALALAEREGDSPRLDREAANLGVALSTLLAADPAEGLRFCVALWPFWLRRIDLTNARRRLAEALTAVPEPTPLRVEALLSAAAIDMRGGLIRTGAAYAEEAYALARTLGDVRMEWRAVQFLGDFAVVTDAGERAKGWMERGLELARRERLPAAEAICIYSLGVAAWIVGDIEEAEALLAQSLDRFRRLSDSAELIPSPVNLGEMRSAEATDQPGLRVVFEETLQPYVEISCRTAVGYVLANQASIARVRGDLGRARELLDESAACFAAPVDSRGEADVLVRRAYLELAEGSVAEARRCLERALELRTELSDRRGIGLVLSGLGFVETTAGEFARAERHLNEALDLFRRAGDRWGLATTLWRTADLGRASGRLEDAEAALVEARAVLAETRRDRWLAHTDAALAEVALLRGDRARAEELLAGVRALYASAGDTAGVSAVEERSRQLAKTPLRPRKDGASRTRDSNPTSKRSTR